MQGLALKNAIEHWRASFGRTRGALIWQLNDIWPSFSWALLDADDRAKPAYEFVRRAFAPLLIAGFEDRGAGTVRLVAVNDHPLPVRVIAMWTVRAGMDGRALEKRVESVVTLAPDGACFDLGTVELLAHAKREGGVAKVFLDFELRAENGEDRLAGGCALLVPPGEFFAACAPNAGDDAGAAPVPAWLASGPTPGWRSERRQTERNALIRPPGLGCAGG
jgi:hypothetical protein